MAEASVTLRLLADLGINLDAITSALETEGVASFAGSFDSLTKVIEQKAAALV
jgi:transaldolase